MRTAIVILIGLAVLGVTIWLVPHVSAAGAFIAGWLIFCVIDWYLGVYRAGYSAMEELHIHALIFAIPTAAALVVIWALRR